MKANELHVSSVKCITGAVEIIKEHIDERDDKNSNISNHEASNPEVAHLPISNLSFLALSAFLDIRYVSIGIVAQDRILTFGTQTLFILKQFSQDFSPVGPVAATHFHDSVSFKCALCVDDHSRAGDGARISCSDCSFEQLLMDPLQAEPGAPAERLLRLRADQEPGSALN